MTDEPGSDQHVPTAMAWAITIGVSMLPDALLHECAGGAPAWLDMAKAKTGGTRWHILFQARW
jgi:hypothetical protein